MSSKNVICVAVCCGNVVVIGIVVKDEWVEEVCDEIVVEAISISISSDKEILVL